VVAASVAQTQNTKVSGNGVQDTSPLWEVWESALAKEIEEFLVAEEESVLLPEKSSKRSTAMQRMLEKSTQSVEQRVPPQVPGVLLVVLQEEADRWDLDMIGMRLRGLEVW